MKDEKGAVESNAPERLEQVSEEGRSEEKTESVTETPGVAEAQVLAAEGKEEQEAEPSPKVMRAQSDNQKGRAGARKQVVDEEDLEDEEQEDEFEEEESQEEGTGEVEEGEHDDPLGEAYDLERGDVLKPTEVEHRAFPWKAKIASPKEFFNTEILYRHDILEEEDRQFIKGAYRIELKGFQGGVWTLHLGDQIEVVNRAEEAEVIVTMQQKDFIDLVNGHLNPQLAVLSKKIRITGDIKRGIRFQSLLAPSVD